MPVVPPSQAAAAFPVVLRAVSPLLDIQSLASALATSSGVWADRASAAASSSIVSGISVDQWEILVSSLGAGRLLRVLRALRDAVGFSCLHELNRTMLARSIPAHVSATMWLMSL